MSEGNLTTYQIVLIVILVLNLVFWLLIILWRIYFLRKLQRSVSRESTGGRSNPAMVVDSEGQSVSGAPPFYANPLSEPPPSYDEAVKYPSLASLLTSTSSEVAPSLPSDPQYSSCNASSVVLEIGNADSSSTTSSQSSCSSSALMSHYIEEEGACSEERRPRRNSPPLPTYDESQLEQPPVLQVAVIHVSNHIRSHSSA